MLAKRRALRSNGVEIRTPILLPSFSSKGFIHVSKIIETTKEVIVGPILVSAYDIHYKEVAPPLEFATLIFLDSGGYEASKDTELSDLGEPTHRVRKWNQEMHSAVVAKWKPDVP